MNKEDVLLAVVCNLTVLINLLYKTTDAGSDYSNRRLILFLIYLCHNVGQREHSMSLYISIAAQLNNPAKKRQIFFIAEKMAQFGVKNHSRNDSH